MLLQDPINFQEYDIPTKQRVRTDALCFNFSWPIFLIIFQILIFVIIYGKDFSVFHPADSQGLRCGINNQQFSKQLLDNRNKTVLSYDGKCTNKCSGKQFLFFCIPIDQHLLQNSDKQFKTSYDFLKYYKFGFSLISIILIISIPLYFSIIKFNSSISFLLPFLIFTVSGIYEIFYNLTVAIVFFVISIIYLLFFFFLRKKINFIKPIFNATFLFLKQNKSLLFVPLFILFSLIVIAFFSIFGFVFSCGVSEPTPIKRQLKQARHNSLSVTTIMFPVVGVWLFEFVLMWARSAICLIISSSYFQSNAPTFQQALALMSHFHSGTFFFGSFVVFIFENLSNLFSFLRQAMKETKSPFVKFLCQCSIKCCFCCIQFIGEINRLSTVYTAIQGVSFWDGCKKASKALQIESLLSVELIINHIFLGIRLFLSFLALLAVFVYQQQIVLYFPMVPILWIPFTVYIALAAIDVTFSASTDAILVCLCEDAHTDGMHGPKDLENIFNWIKEKVAQETFRD